VLVLLLDSATVESTSWDSFALVGGLPGEDSGDPGSKRLSVFTVSCLPFSLYILVIMLLTSGRGE